MKLISFLVLLLSTSQIASGAHPHVGVIDIIQQAKKHMYQHPMEAIKYAEFAHEKAEESNDSILLFQSKVTLGASYSLNGNYDLALNTYLSAESYIDYKDLTQVANFNINMASMYYNLDNPYKAHTFNNLAYKTYKEINDSLGVSWCLNLKGLIYIQEKKFNLAQAAMDSSLLINRYLNNQNGKYIVINNLAMIPGDETFKIDALKEAIDYNIAQQNQWALAENYNNLGLLYLKTKEIAKAKLYFNKAGILADSLHANVIKRDYLNHAMQIAIIENRYKDAFEYYSEMNDIDKHISSIDKIRRLEGEATRKKHLKYRTKLQEKEADIEQAKKENIIIAGTLMLIIIILIVGLYYLRRLNRLILEAKNKEVKEIEEKLADKSKINIGTHQLGNLNFTDQEMSDLIYFIKSKEVLLENIIKMLYDTQRMNNDDAKANIKFVIAMIKNFKEKERNSDIFINDIRNSEELFLEKLSSMHNDLSKNDIILATLLRIKLSSKEIASLIDSNPKTVNMARYRLRKKLNLETDDNLISYFETL